jgi:hypothetical protein
MRMLMPLQGNSPLGMVELKKWIGQVLRGVDRYHCFLLYQLKDAGRVVPDPWSRREAFLMWLIQSIIKPTEGLPMHGLVPIGNNQSPWDHLSRKDSVKLFGPVQRELLAIFSQTHANDQEHDLAHLKLVVTWYAIHFPDEKQELISHQATAKITQLGKRKQSKGKSNS